MKTEFDTWSFHEAPHKEKRKKTEKRKKKKENPHSKNAGKDKTVNEGLTMHDSWFIIILTPCSLVYLSIAFLFLNLFI